MHHSRRDPGTRGVQRAGPAPVGRDHGPVPGPATGSGTSSPPSTASAKCCSSRSSVSAAAAAASPTSSVPADDPRRRLRLDARRRHQPGAAAQRPHGLARCRRAARSRRRCWSAARRPRSTPARARASARPGRANLGPAAHDHAQDLLAAGLLERRARELLDAGVLEPRLHFVARALVVGLAHEPHREPLAVGAGPERLRERRRRPPARAGRPPTRGGPTTRAHRR